MPAARKLLRCLKEAILLEESPWLVNGSIGIASFPEHGAAGESLLQKADIAMYAAKMGKLECAIYSAERDEQAHRRLAMMTELQEGIEREEFVCEYQPQVSLKTGNVVCVEAHARWQHPRQGLLPPEAFIPASGETGLVDF